MIIKTTFSDNDYTQILEEYWDNFWFKNYYNVVKDIEDPNKYKDIRIDMEELLEKVFYNEDTVTVKEMQRFENYIKESILLYIKEFHSDEYDYLKEQLFVNIRLSIRDKNENGEVVYYFLKQKKYITM